MGWTSFLDRLRRCLYPASRLRAGSRPRRPSRWPFAEPLEDRRPWDMPLAATLPLAAGAGVLAEQVLASVLSPSGNDKTIMGGG